MVEIVCMSHGGIRCGIPSTQVIAFRPPSAGAKLATLWPPRGVESVGTEHVFELATPVGPTLVRGRGVRVEQLAPDAVRPLSPFLRQFLTLPHVVGVSEIDGDLVWLVDANRFVPDASAGGPQ